MGSIPILQDSSVIPNLILQIWIDFSQTLLVWVFARCETPFLTYSCVCPDFAFDSKSKLSANLCFSFPCFQESAFLSVFLLPLLSVFGWVFRTCFQSHVETPPCSAFAFLRLSESLMSCAESLFALNILFGTSVVHLGFAVTKFIDLGFAIAELSLEVHFCPLLDIALSPRDFLFEKINGFKRTTEVHTVQQMKKMIPLITREASFGSCHQIGSWCQRI